MIEFADKTIIKCKKHGWVRIQCSYKNAKSKPRVFSCWIQEKVYKGNIVASVDDLKIVNVEPKRQK